MLFKKMLITVDIIHRVAKMCFLNISPEKVLVGSKESKEEVQTYFYDLSKTMSLKETSELNF